MIFLSLLVILLFALGVGIPFVWLGFGTKYRGLLLYVLSFLFGWALASFGIFLLSFLSFRVDGLSYLLLFGIVWALFFVVRFGVRNIRNIRSSFVFFLDTLKIDFPWKSIKSSYLSLSGFQKSCVVGGLIFLFAYLFVSFLHVAYFPSYHIDSYLHWNNPVLYILKNLGTIPLPQENYPFFLAIFKALVLGVMGGWKTIGINLFQWLIYVFFGLFVGIVGWKHTKNIFLSLLPLVLVSCLPLVYFQVVDGYMDFVLLVYIVVAIYFVYEYLVSGDTDSMLLSWGMMGISVFLKNDGAFVYVPVLGVITVFMLIFSKKFVPLLFSVFSSWRNALLFVFIPLYFVLPYVLYRYNITPVDGGFGGYIPSLEVHRHREILAMLPSLFFRMGTYNVVLIPVVLLYGRFFAKKLYKTPLLVFFLVPVGIFVHMLFSVYVFSWNFLWALNQTAINRGFTMVFVLLLSFVGLYLGGQSLSPVKKKS